MTKREILLVGLILLMTFMFILFHESSINLAEHKAMYERFGVVINHYDYSDITAIKIPSDKSYKVIDDTHLLIIDKKKEP